jgi:predicted porin
MVYGSTDIANNGSGAFASYPNGARPELGMRMGRANNMVQYRTPDLSGFQGALGVNMKAGKNKSGTDNDYSSAGDDTKDENNVEMWTAAAKYSVQGFTGAFAYSARPDTRVDIDPDSDRRYIVTGNDNMRTAGSVVTDMNESVFVTPGVNNGPPTDGKVSKKEDKTAWTARLGYAQDNWSVNGWYGKDNTSDLNPAMEDAKYVSVGGGVSVGKVNMYSVWEQSDTGMNEDATTIIGIQYNLGSRSRIWMDYAGLDRDSAPTAEDNVSFGLRHDF